MTRGRPSQAFGTDRIAFFASLGIGFLAALGSADGLSRSFWRDEASTATAVDRSISDLLALFGNADGGFAGYYLMIWPWIKIAGTSEAAFRLPSLVAMAFTVAVAGLLAFRIAQSLAAPLVTAVLLATSPVLFPFYAVEARPYAMTMFFVTLAALWAHDASHNRRSSWWWAVAGSLAISTHVLAILAVAPLGLWVLRRPSTLADARNVFRSAFGPSLVVAATTAFIFVLASRASSLQSWIPDFALSEVIEIARTLLTATGAIAAAGLAVAVIAAKLSGARITVTPTDIATLGLWAALPLTTLALLSAVSVPSLVLRYVLVSTPAIAIAIGVVAAGMLAAAIDQTTSRRGRLSTLVVVAVTGLVALSSAATSLPTDSQDKLEDLERAAQWIGDERQSDELILYVPTWAELGPRWYLNEDGLQDINLAAEPGVDETDTDTLFRSSRSVDDIRDDLLNQSSIFSVGYDGLPVWEPVEELGLPLQDQLDRCFSPTTTKKFGQLVVKRWSRATCK